MKEHFLKKLLRQGIIVSLVIALTFTQVFALDGLADEPQEPTAATEGAEQTEPTVAIEEKEQEESTVATEEEEQEESVAKETQDTLEEAEVQQESDEQKALPSISASSSDRDEEPMQEYEEGANSWRFSEGEVLRDEESAVPLLYASFTPWAWSESKGGYLNSNGSVIQGVRRKGIDVSSWQGDIDWAKVKKSDVDFAIIRCGYGDDLTYQDDGKWKRNVQQCEKYGIPYGVYIYSYADTDAHAKSEVQHVLRLLKEAGASPDYPIYYDLEDKVVEACGKTAIVRRAKIFCSAIEAQGYRAGIYANLNWWNKYLNDSSLNKYEKWVAQWNYRCTYEGSYRLWQCTSSGKVPGIDGRVDLNFEFKRDDTNYYMGRWKKDSNGNTVFQKPNGSIAKSQWITYKGYKYYVNSTGKRVTGFNTIKGYRYYFNKYGVLQKSKWLTVSSKKYYALSSGKLATGYKKIGNYYYGFNSKGVMLKGTAILNGKRYKFTENKGRAYLFTAKTKTKLNYRTGPSTSYKRKGTYAKNKTLGIIRQKDGWGQTTTGYWVKLSYTKKVTTYPQFVEYKVKTKTALNYRTGPSTSYKKKGTYKKGTVITIKAEKNGWGKTKSGYWIKLSYTNKL